MKITVITQKEMISIFLKRWTRIDGRCRISFLKLRRSSMSHSLPRGAVVLALFISLSLALTLEAEKKAGPAAPEFPESVLAGLTWRSIGPANMGGRIDDVAVVEKNPRTLY